MGHEVNVEQINAHIYIYIYKLRHCNFFCLGFVLGMNIYIYIQYIYCICKYVKYVCIYGAHTQIYRNISACCLNINIVRIYVRM